MSDDSRASGGVPGWVWIVGALFVVLLGVNLAMTVFSERLPEVLSAKLVQAAAFWGGWGAAFAASFAGWLWAGKALERHDRDSTRRLRSCFLIAMSAVILLAIATFEDALERPQLAAVAAALMALAIVPFAVSTRALTERSHRRRRRRRSSDESS